MNVTFTALQESHLGFAGIFACIGVGFLCLRWIETREPGPGYWAASFFSNSLGFILWSGAVPIQPRLFYLIGELFHIVGFWFLIAGAYRFAGNRFRGWNLAVLGAWSLAWALSIALILVNPATALFLLKALRALLFIASGLIILLRGYERETLGTRIAGAGLILWGVYILAFAFIRINDHLYFGFLCGFHVLAAFGMVAMAMDKIRVLSEENEKRIKKLEGILPICSYCKKIRDEKNEWQALELYIEDRSKAEFSHGICPDCFAKHRPDR
jgi:hypothetical protein